MSKTSEETPSTKGGLVVVTARTQYTEEIEQDEGLFSCEKKVNDISDKFTINMPYVIAYTVCYGLGTWHTSFALVGNAQTTKIFEAKFNWDKDDTIFYNTMISSSAIIGMAFGSIASGSLIKFGRRKTAIYTHILALCSSLICMYDTVFCLILGRFLLGISAGLANVIFSKSINENFPEKLSSQLAMLCNASICSGIFVAFSMGGILPDPEDMEANKSD